jgi:hypothetical protein
MPAAVIDTPIQEEQKIEPLSPAAADAASTGTPSF